LKFRFFASFPFFPFLSLSLDRKILNWKIPLIFHGKTENTVSQKKERDFSKWVKHSADMDFMQFFSWPTLLSVSAVVAVVIWKWNQSSSPPPPPRVNLSNTNLKKKEKPTDNKEDAIAKGLIPVKIFFGSQTGTAEDFSHKLAADAKRYKFHPSVVDLEGYETVTMGK
jgi:sulfite reductase alpha subunit-like flavoprotein